MANKSPLSESTEPRGFNAARRAPTVLLAASLVALVPGLPYLELGTMWLLVTVAPESGWDPTPLGLTYYWDMSQWLFLIGVSRLVGGAAAAAALTMIGWRGGGRMRHALVAILVLSAVTVLEAVFVLVDTGCLFMDDTPWTCSVGD